MVTKKKFTKIADNLPFLHSVGVAHLRSLASKSQQYSTQIEWYGVHGAAPRQRGRVDGRHLLDYTLHLTRNNLTEWCVCVRSVRGQSTGWAWLRWCSGAGERVRVSHTFDFVVVVVVFVVVDDVVTDSDTIAMRDSRSSALHSWLPRVWRGCVVEWSGVSECVIVLN